MTSAYSIIPLQTHQELSHLSKLPLQRREKIPLNFSIPSPGGAIHSRLPGEQPSCSSFLCYLPLHLQVCGDFSGSCFHCFNSSYHTFKAMVHGGTPSLLLDRKTYQNFLYFCYFYLQNGRFGPQPSGKRPPDIIWEFCHVRAATFDLELPCALSLFLQGRSKEHKWGSVGKLVATQILENI